MQTLNTFLLKYFSFTVLRNILAMWINRMTPPRISVTIEIILSCDSCKATLTESKNKNVQRKMSVKVMFWWKIVGKSPSSCKLCSDCQKMKPILQAVWKQRTIFHIIIEPACRQVWLNTIWSTTLQKRRSSLLPPPVACYVCFLLVEIMLPRFTVFLLISTE